MNPALRPILILCALLLSLQPLQAAQPAAPPLDQLYGALPRGEGLRLSPDGKSLAMIAPADDRRALVVWHLDGSAPAVIKIKGFEPEWLTWVSDRRILAGLSAPGRGAVTPYRGTVGALFDLDGSEVTEMPPEVDLEHPGKEDLFVTSLSNPSDAVGQARVLAQAVDFASRTTRRLDASAEQFRDGFLGRTDDGRLLFELWIRKDRVGAVVSVSEDGRHAGLAERPDKGAVHWMADAAGTVRLKVVIENDEQRKIYVRDTAKGDWRLIHNDQIDKHPLFGAPVFAEANLDPQHAFQPLAFSAADPAVLQVAFAGPDGHVAIGAFDTRSGRMGPVIAAEAGRDLQPVLHDHLLIGYRAGDGPVHYLDPAYAKAAAMLRKALPDQDIDIIDVSRDEKMVLLTASRGAEPPVYWLLDRKGVKAVLDPALTPYPGIAPEQVAQPRRVEFPARDGAAIPALLTMPVGRGPAPVPFVVLVHDGPAAHDDGRFDWLVQFLSAQGYGVLQPQYRGSASFGLSLERGGDREWGWKMQDDVTDGTEWLVKSGFADPQRICIAGSGYGGYSALMGTVRQPGLYRCAAALGAITDVKSFVENRSDRGWSDRPEHGLYREIDVARIAKGEAERARTAVADRSADAVPELVITDHPDPTPDELERISPLFRAEEIAAPVFLAHGRKDTLVEPAQSEELERRLTALGKPVQALYFDESDQFLRHAKDRTALLRALRAFLADNLGQGRPGRLSPS